jgi:gluconate 2-dehydrogenase gamma chain
MRGISSAFRKKQHIGRTSMADDPIERRRFLLGAGLAGTAVATGFTSGLPASEAQAQPVPTPAHPTPAANAEPDTYLVLTPTEQAFLSATADTMIPADELSPSGTDCGIVTFIDRQLASAWGGGAKTYRSGPFLKGKPEQGYQLSLTPKEFFQAGIAAANEWSRKTYGKEFDRLSVADRNAALRAIQEGKAEFKSFSSRAFFGQLLTITMQGFFSDPVYGGNRDKVSWKMLGYPGLPATYSDKVDAYREKRYVAAPQSISDFS